MTRTTADGGAANGTAWHDPGGHVGRRGDLVRMAEEQAEVGSSTTWSLWMWSSAPWSPLLSRQGGGGRGGRRRFLRPAAQPSWVPGRLSSEAEPRAGRARHGVAGAQAVRR